MYKTEIFRLARVARLIDELIDNTSAAIDHGEGQLARMEDTDCERGNRIERLLCRIEDVVPNLEKAKRSIVKALDEYKS